MRAQQTAATIKEAFTSHVNRDRLPNPPISPLADCPTGGTRSRYARYGGYSRTLDSIQRTA